ncbi:SPFH domain / Band 7 family protein [Dehalogenimonas formicexedens]|uniref:SPFH domain / Band 7 family protein n=1 Tax=Dehalogenimonas formicexedens TaxID=1839801 RepID=A0A1P8F8A5_9CHLR|nr:SPFH domain-containing protein [Dehalogenimonas formicexedens]APV44685.1 SPFH domain / Band 7 family protein [Dehalogenimonas formicexedens]
MEKTVKALPGYPMLITAIVILGLSIWLMVAYTANPNVAEIILFVLGYLVSVLIFAGLFVVNPNEAKVLILFGKYTGTVRQNGFFWANPFLTKKKISLRARNLSGQKLKVNDKVGNPIEIAAVIVWQVKDTFKASFDVDNYEDYVIIQSEAAVRHLAQQYPYDSFENEEQEEGLTLRSGADQVNRLLEAELQERLSRAGVAIIEARISHLAYAPEIAEAMLRRQQATAVVAARSRIVQGAVSMVEMALSQLSERHLVELDEERRAAMVSNLLVVLCSESAASPVINAGTLYQ